MLFAGAFCFGLAALARNIAGIAIKAAPIDGTDLRNVRLVILQ